MRTTRRTLLVLAVLALVLPLAATAGAKGKPAPPPRPAEPVLYEVTMTVKEGYNGLATTCDGPITMEFGDRFGYKAGRALPPSELAVTAPDIGFLGECHGDQTNVPPPVLPAILQITADRAGNPTGLVWHFDYNATQTTYGKDKVRIEVLEWLTLRSLCDPVDPEYADCEEFKATETAAGVYDVSGTFTLYRWTPALSPRPVFQGSSLFEFEMTFTTAP
jgi:hypothetical protein